MKPKLLHQLPDNVEQFLEQHPDVVEIIIDFMERMPLLKPTVENLIKSYMLMVDCFDRGGKLFICGNGGSFADSLHISGELMKSFQRNRKLKQQDREKFLDSPEGEVLADALEYGFGFAQELFALGKKNDVLLGISTSGNAQNVIYAMTTAKVIGIATIGLTGELGGELARIVDVPIQVPGNSTHRIQELHLHVYHTLCAIVEAHYFKEPKAEYYLIG